MGRPASAPPLRHRPPDPKRRGRAGPAGAIGGMRHDNRWADAHPPVAQGAAISVQLRRHPADGWPLPVELGHVVNNPDLGRRDNEEITFFKSVGNAIQDMIVAGAALQAAEDQRSEADSVLAAYRAKLNDATTEAGRIIEEARQAADQIKRDQEARLQSELAELRTRAVADIDAAKAKAMSDLRSEVTALAIGAAETVVQRNLDAETQTQLVEDYINQVAAQRS